MAHPGIAGDPLGRNWTTVVLDAFLLPWGDRFGQPGTPPAELLLIDRDLDRLVDPGGPSEEMRSSRSVFMESASRDPTDALHQSMESWGPR